MDPRAWPGGPSLQNFSKRKTTTRPTPKRQAPVASVTHFLVKLVCAAPCRFFSLACESQDFLASVSHFFMKLFIAAPASFLSAAVALQLSAYAAVVAKVRMMAMANFFMMAFPDWQHAAPRAATMRAYHKPVFRLRGWRWPKSIKMA